jgi:DNA-directed RNA polymerase specialized sigma24 family protein
MQRSLPQESSSLGGSSGRMFVAPLELEVYRVFLASPSDVMEERAVALEVVNRLNTTLLQNQGKLIHLTGWEYLAPGAGRPQDIINALVKDCDIFVGLLHERWGTPTGGWTSGFEEEFNLAQERRQRTGNPHMAMFFKDASPEVEATPTLDFEQVQAFRERIGQHHLYDTVAVLDDWRYKLSLLLMQAVDVGPGSSPAPGGDVTERELLRAAIGRLTDQEQTVFGLYYFEGMTLAQVGDVLGVSERTVSDIHEKAVLMLRLYLPGDVVDRLHSEG